MLKFNLSDLKDIQEINCLSDDCYPNPAVYFSAKDGDKLLAYCVFILEEKAARLLDLCPVGEQEEYLLLTAAKAAFNILDLGGVRQITCQNKKLTPLLLKLGFSEPEENSFSLSLEGYFTPCSCNTGKKSLHEQAES